jgi:hypothetical protein
VYEFEAKLNEGHLPLAFDVTRRVVDPGKGVFFSHPSLAACRGPYLLLTRATKLAVCCDRLCFQPNARQDSQRANPLKNGDAKPPA